MSASEGAGGAGAARTGAKGSAVPPGAAAAARGRLRLYLGYAAGVGKTYRMLGDALEMKRAGLDVVIGYVEPHRRPATAALAEPLETIPRRALPYRGTTIWEMDAPAVLRRRPRVCVVDELAHSNAPGAERGKRWEDALALLEAGVDVLTTMNIQHLESLNDQVRTVSGVSVRETVPDWVVRRADEVVMVDLTPRALLHRLERGDIYEPERARRAAENFFRETTLVALRELALRQVAREVESREAERREAERDAAERRELKRGAAESRGTGSAPSAVEASRAGERAGKEPVRGEATSAADGEAPSGGRPADSAAARAMERILIYVTADPASLTLVRRGRRVADYLRADCLAVGVLRPDEEEEEELAVARHLNFARHLRVETRELRGADAAAALVEFARERGATQLFVARPHKRGGGLRGLMRLIRLARGMQVIVVANRPPRADR